MKKVKNYITKRTVRCSFRSVEVPLLQKEEMKGNCQSKQKD